MAIPYPSELFRPYVVEPIGEFLSAWGPPVLYPLATWALLIIMCVSFVVIAMRRSPESRRAEAESRIHQEQERQRLLRERSGGISG